MWRFDIAAIALAALGAILLLAVLAAYVVWPSPACGRGKGVSMATYAALS